MRAPSVYIHRKSGTLKPLGGALNITNGTLKPPWNPFITVKVALHLAIATLTRKYLVLKSRTKVQSVEFTDARGRIAGQNFHSSID